MPKTFPGQQDDYKKIIAFINSKEFFWLKELRTHCGARQSDTTELINSRIQNVIGRLRKIDAISCIERRDKERKYRRLRVITPADVGLQ